jgi:hypothetical protein
MVGSVAAPDRNLAAMVFTIKRADSVSPLRPHTVQLCGATVTRLNGGNGDLSNTLGATAYRSQYRRRGVFGLSFMPTDPKSGRQP